MNKKLLIAFLALMTMMTSCQKKNKNTDRENPFFQEWDTYFHTPDFAAIKMEDYKPAFEEGMRRQEKEIEEIVNNPEAPTFANTIEALEKSGELLSRVGSVFFAMASAHTNDDIVALSNELSPKLSEHSSKIALNEKLFDRIRTLQEGNKEDLTPEQKRVLQLYYDGYVKSGALLNAEDKKKLAELNKEEAALTTEFGNRLNKASSTPIYFSKEELQGLPEQELNKAAEAANKEGKKGQYLFRLDNTTQQSILARLDNRATRKKIFEASEQRCLHGDANDTEELVRKIAILRAEKASLMGKPNYASWKMSDALAKEPKNALELLTQLSHLSKNKIVQETQEIEDFARRTEGKDFQLEAWDWNYYAEKLKKEKYGVDEAMISQYFVVDSVLKNGVFFAANKMYGLTFAPRTDIPVYQEDVTAWDVIDKNGEKIALFFFDPYSRPSKSGGAWMSNFVEQSFMKNRKPVIYNVCNNPKPAPGDPALISWDNVETMFHEFGHALHGIFAAQQYEYVSGTNVPRDFVEMPSQFNEHAATDPEVFAHYAKHYKTGEVMPKDLQEKMLRAQNFNQAYPLAENVAACIVDLAWHTLTPEQAKAIKNVNDFEKETLIKYDVDYKAIPPRYRSTYFRHVISNGYSAGYYSYLWTEAMAHDIYETMAAKGGLSAENGQRFRELILSRGNASELMPLFQEMTGHEKVDINPLLKARGLK